MSEILQLQVGQCGNQLGTKSWQTICQEHCIDALGNQVKGRDDELDRLSTYYTEGIGGRYLPRALLVDLEPGTADSVRASTLGKLFKLENYVLGQSGAGNNWAKGHYTEGAELVDSVLDMMRLEIEQCDSYQGAQLIHSISGGTGSGLGTLLLSKHRQEYPDRMLATFSVLSNPGTTDSLVSPYNAVLSLHQMIENADTCVLFDNGALYHILFRIFQRKSYPTMGDLNQLLSKALSGITCPWRFRTGVNCNMRKMAYNLVPYPRYHFLMASYAPLGEPYEEQFQLLNYEQLTELMFRERNVLCDTNMRGGRLLAGAVTYQGKNASKEAGIETIMKYKDKLFSEWPNTPSNIKVSTCDIQPSGRKNAGTLLSNSTSIHSAFQVINEQFTAMFRRKAFLHWYLGQGMDQMEFVEAQANLTDMIDEYRSCEVLPDEEEPHDEEERN